MGLFDELWRQQGNPSDDFRRQVLQQRNAGAVPFLNDLLGAAVHEARSEGGAYLRDVLTTLRDILGPLDEGAVWLTAFAAWCLRFLRERRAAGLLTLPREQGRADPWVRRAALAWQVARDLAESHDSAGRDHGARWHGPTELAPSPDASQFATEPPPLREAVNAALAVLDGVGCRATGRAFQVFFPVVIRTAGVTIPGPIFTAGIKEVSRARDDSTSRLPSLVLAPWSAWALAPAEFLTVRTLFDDPKLRELLGIQAADATLLLELEPAELRSPGPAAADGSTPFPSLPDDADSVHDIQVYEQSHNLALMIVAWAAFHRKNLRRICATGQVIPDEDGPVNSVVGCDRKLQSVQRLARARNEHILFLAPDRDVNHLYGRGGPQVQINGRRRDGEAPIDKLADLFDCPGLLTDDFDEYRKALAEANPAKQLASDGAEDDERSLRQLVEKAPLDVKALPTPAPVFFSCGFGDEPWRAAFYLLAALARRIEDADIGRPGTAAEHRVPLPILLHHLEAGGGPAERLFSAVQAALHELQDWLGQAPAVDQLTLENTVRFDPEKLLLVVIARPSLDEVPFQKAPLGVLKDYATAVGSGGAAPGFLFVASDYHHELFLKGHFDWQRGKSSTPHP